MPLSLYIDSRPSGTKSSDNHFFSFFSDEGADSFPENYFSHQDLHTLYGQTYSNLFDFIEKNKGSSLYNDIDVLWALKKLIFDTISYCTVRREIIRRVVEAVRPDRIILPADAPEADAISLSDIAAAAPLAVQVLQSEIPAARKKESGAKGKRPVIHLMEAAVRRFLNTRDSEGRNVALYAHFQKVSAVADRIKPNVVLYCDPDSLRTRAKALAKGFGFYGAAPGFPPSVHQAQWIDDFLKASFWEELPVSPFHSSAFLERILWKRIRNNLSGLLPRIDQARDFFMLHPSVRHVLVDEDVTPHKNAFIQAAKKQGSVSAVLCHGALGHKIGYLPLTADFMFVWGKSQAEKINQWGLPFSRVRVTGCGHYKKYQDMPVATVVKAVTRTFRLDPEVPIGLVAFPPASGQRYPFENLLKKKLIIPTLEELSRLKSVQFIIKLHPGAHDIEFYRDWLSRYGSGRFTLTTDYDPYLLARACSFLVVHASTYAVDALALNKPVICLHDDWYPILEEYRSFNCFYYADDRETLSRTVNYLISGIDPLEKSRQTAQRECLGSGTVSPEEAIVKALLNPGEFPS